MRRATPRHHQSHRIPFITKRGLHADEDITQLKPLNQQLAGKRIHTTRRRTPVSLNFINIGTKTAILSDAHSIGYVGRRAKGFGVSPDKHFSQLIGTGRQVDFVTFALKSLKRVPEAGKYIEVRCRSNVSLVWRKAEKS